MTGSREESVTFSLKALQQLEDDRIERENKDRAEAERSRLDAERQAIEARETQARALAEERERQRRRELDEVAQKEAMQKAIVEQARVEVEIRARADERERERRHELELAKLRSKPPPARGFAFVGASFAGAAITLAVCLVTYFGIVRPASDKRVAELRTQLAAADARGDSLANRGEEQRKTIAELKAELDARPKPPPTAVATPPRPPTYQPPTVPTIKKPVAPLGEDCRGREKDPMCFGVPR